MTVKAEKFYIKGRDALQNNRTLEALALFEKAFDLEPKNPVYQSFVGFCIACERGKIKEAISLCESALRAEPQKVDVYCNLGRVYLRAGFKLKAIEVFRNGLKIDNKNPWIIAELHALGTRKKAVLPFLPRGNFLNKYLGIFFSRIGLR